jgi:hypothetical protein
MTSVISDFNGNDYRKRVLAAIEARGGIPASDPFEWYDVPLEQADRIGDDEVAAQVAAVWAFWQKQRDHPKYRGLVTALLAVHHQAAAQLCESDSRRRLAAQIRAERAERDESRFAELDGAIERLVERFGGIPRSKLEGLRAFARQSGDPDERSVEARLARHRVIDDPPAGARPAPAAVSPAVYRQVRADLDELGRILGAPAPAGLYDLLGLEPGAPAAQVSRERDLAAAHNRELRPDRRRALVDDLLAAVTTLLLDNDPEAYLDAVAEDVTARLRPRVAAAVLVEDEFTAADYGHLLGEAQTLGLDRARAVGVLAELARELAVAIPTTRPAATTPSSPPPAAAAGPGSGTASHQALSQARAALRAGRVREAQALVARARQLAGGLLPPIRAVGDEVDQVLAEADQRWRAGLQALSARRFTEALHTLERLQKIAEDVPGPAGQRVADVLAQARTGADQAAAALAAAEALVGDARELALLDAWRAAPDHPDLLAALTRTGVQPATNVRTRITGGQVVVSWDRSRSPGTIDYRVEYLDGAGGRRSLGTTQSTELEAALPRDAGPASGYAVTARRAGISAPEAQSAAPQSAAPQSAAPRSAAPGSATTRSAAARPDTTSRSPVTATAPIASLALLPHGRRVRLVYPAPTEGRAEVRRLPAGAVLPSPGSVVPDPGRCGDLVPGMGPGLAVDSRPPSPTAYLVLAIDPSGQVAVAGASAWYVRLPPVCGLHRADGRLRWDWPSGCTEVVVAWRADAPPERADDPAAVSRKVTNTRYQIDQGFPIPTETPLHIAVFTATRLGGALVTGPEAPPAARLAPS